MDNSTVIRPGPSLKTICKYLHININQTSIKALESACREKLEVKNNPEILQKMINLLTDRNNEILSEKTENDRQIEIYAHRLEKEKQKTENTIDPIKKRLASNYTEDQIFQLVHDARGGGYPEHIKGMMEALKRINCTKKEAFEALFSLADDFRKADNSKKTK